MYRVLLFFIFQAKYLAWTSPAHNFDFLSINLAFNICINIYMQSMSSEDIWPKIDQKLKKLCFYSLVTSLGKTCTNFFSYSLDPLRPYFLYLTKKLCACITLSQNLSSKTHFCKKAVFFLSR